METGYFYFLTDDYFIDFQDPYLERNKETIGTGLHDRPCFFSFIDVTTNIYWMVPISSKIEKFKKYSTGKSVNMVNVTQ